MAQVQHIRFQRPPAAPKPVIVTAPTLLRDVVESSSSFSPSFATAFRILVFARVLSAVYGSVTADCDEVYNYWEPLHFLQYGNGFRTWEYSAAYAIRSWLYLLIHLIPAKAAALLAADDKRVAFFAVRIALGVVSSICDAAFYKAIADHIHPKIGRYCLILLFTSAGLFNAATALLPSSFSLYFVTLAYAFAMQPVNSNTDRTWRATICFAVAALLGWPFSIVLAVPFVIEELYMYGSEKVKTEKFQQWRVGRFQRFSVQVVLAGLLIGIPLVLVDYYYYGKLAIGQLNIVLYNVLSSKGGDLYGTEPWYYYIMNGLLNFNIAFPLALISFPLAILSACVDQKRWTPTVTKRESTASTLLLARLLPLYLWFGLLTSQAHKEERFMFPAFSLICFNAAVSIYLLRGLLETAHLRVKRAPYLTQTSKMFSAFTWSVLTVSAVISFCRVAALFINFHSTMQVFFAFQYQELPKLAIHNYPNHYPQYAKEPPSNLTTAIAAADTRFDLSPIRELNLTLCYGKEWYRFPSHYLVPEGIRVEFVKSTFAGILPKHFQEKKDMPITSRRELTKLAPSGFNDENLEEMDRYIPTSQCHYYIDLDFPHRASEPWFEVHHLEPRHAIDTENWHRVICLPFLDSQQSSFPNRAFWLPSKRWNAKNKYGDFCLLRNKKLVDLLI